MFNVVMAAPVTSDFRLAPLVVARFVGLYLVLFAIVVFVATGLVAALDLPGDVLVGVLLLGLAGLVGLAWWLRSGTYVVRFVADGYRVKMVRGAGVTGARWVDVENASTFTLHNAACVGLRLRDGRTTTIPVETMAIDREQFVRELQQHLQGGQGLRAL